jgi:lipoate-protein ligase A
MMAEEKIAGGKLVCVEVEAVRGRIIRVKITGDFFIHPEDAISGLENALRGASINTSESEAESILAANLGNATLVGMSCHDLARLFRRAVG